MYSGHSFDIYTFIQHTFCLYLEALNRPHGRHAKVIIGADIIHNRQARDHTATIFWVARELLSCYHRATQQYYRLMVITPELHQGVSRASAKTDGFYLGFVSLQIITLSTLNWLLTVFTDWSWSSLCEDPQSAPWRI